MKKILCLLLVVIMACSCLAACGENTTEPNKTPIDNSQGEMLEETKSEPTTEENASTEEQSSIDPAELTEYTIKVNNKELKLPMSYKDFVEAFDYEPMGIVSFGDLIPSKEYSTHGNFENLGDTTFYIRNTCDGLYPVEQCDVMGVMLFPGESIDIFGIKDEHKSEDVKKILGEPSHTITGVNTVFSYIFPEMNFYGYACSLEVVFEKDETVGYVRYGVFDTTYSVNN